MFCLSILHIIHYGFSKGRQYRASKKIINVLEEELSVTQKKVGTRRVSVQKTTKMEIGRIVVNKEVSSILEASLRGILEKYFF